MATELIKTFKGSTSEERGQIFRRMFDGVIGGNAMQYMQNFMNDTRFGHQHYSYPIEWLEDMIKDDNWTFIGVWDDRGFGKTATGNELRTLVDATPFIDYMKTHHNNENGAICRIHDIYRELLGDDYKGAIVWYNNFDLKQTKVQIFTTKALS